MKVKRNILCKKGKCWKQEKKNNNSYLIQQIYREQIIK